VGAAQHNIATALVPIWLHLVKSIQDV